MNWTLASAFWGISILLVLTPGMDWAYVMSTGIRQRSGVIPGVAGVLTGHLVATLAVAAGVATILTSAPSIEVVLTLAGASYLTWLGITQLRQPPSPISVTAAPLEPGSIFVRGVTMNLLNPKLWLFFLALLPQFVSPQASLPAGAQIMMLGAMHISTCTLIYLGLGFGAAAIFGRRPRASRMLGRLSGVVMVLLGVSLMVEQVVGIVN